MLSPTHSSSHKNGLKVARLGSELQSTYWIAPVVRLTATHPGFRLAYPSCGGSRLLCGFVIELRGTDHPCQERVLWQWIHLPIHSV